MTQGQLVYGGTTWEKYAYDAHGHRTLSTRNTGTTRHQIYTRTGQLLYIEDTKDNQRIDYIHLGNKLVAQRSRPISGSTATLTYHHTDSIQSANVETNASGAQTYRTVRAPYGSPYNGVYREGPGFAGHVTDTQTNLTYMQQRYYDPVAVRFLSPDPVDVSTNNGSNFNRYWYANNNPYRYTDPDGRESGCLHGNSCGDFSNVNVQSAGIVLDFTPIVGDIKAIAEAVSDPSVANIAATVIGLAGPIDDGLGKTIKGADRIADGARAVGSPTAGKKVDSATRERILTRDQNSDDSWTCATCGQRTSNPDNIHTGHLTPRSKGGDLSHGNLRCEGAHAI